VRVLLVRVLLVTVVALLLPAGAAAQEGHRAGLIIVHGDGRVVQQCVSFSEESISGYELLQRGNLALSVEAGGFGATVCSIDGEGCSYPAESCFCRCQGTPCVYWSYWRLQADGAWRYQPLGAGNTQVANGDVEAWRWAEGSTRSAVEPPAARFEDICAAPPLGEMAVETEVTTGTPAATAQTAIAAPQTGAGQTGAGQTSARQTSAAGAGAGDAVIPSPAPALTPSLILLGAGALVLPAAALLVWALLRRK
jgi:hypothetical protein